MKEKTKLFPFFKREQIYNGLPFVVHGVDTHKFRLSETPPPLNHTYPISFFSSFKIGACDYSQILYQNIKKKPLLNLQKDQVT